MVAPSRFERELMRPRRIVLPLHYRATYEGRPRRGKKDKPSPPRGSVSTEKGPVAKNVKNNRKNQ